MYLTSTQLKRLSENELASYERQGRLKLPQPYRNFMNTYGTGTYGGAICIQPPDFDLLKEYSDYDFWQHENAPISKEQLKECVVIGNSIDGDFIALHANLNGYLLLPRGSDTITFLPYHSEEFTDTIMKTAFYLYDEKLEDYFEPVGNSSVFLRAVNRDLRSMADRFKAAFHNDYLIENEYTCKVFLARMGGFVRFNLSCESEIAIFYSDYGTECFQEVKNFLMENGCT